MEAVPISDGSRAQIQPDGYTLLLASTANAANATLYPKLRFNFLADSTPVGSIGIVPNVLVVHPDFPAKTLPEFIESARNKPGAIAMGLPGNGSPQHLRLHCSRPCRKPSSCLFSTRVAGQYSRISSEVTSRLLSHPRSHRPQTSSPALCARLPSHPRRGCRRYPTFRQSANSSADTKQQTSKEFSSQGNARGYRCPAKYELNAALKDDAVFARLDTLGIGPVAMTPSAFGEFLASETKKWGDVIKSADIRMD